MAQDLMRFHSRDKFEVFVYATTSPDHPAFLSQVLNRDEGYDCILLFILCSYRHHRQCHLMFPFLVI